MISFERRMAERAAKVELALTAILDGAERAGTPPRLAAAMRHAVLGGGKRLRPFLVIESAATVGFRLAPPSAVIAGCAVELVHCYSLVHDDLPAMDNDRLRRGKPTVWAAFDEWTAILAGDALLTLAFEVLSDPALHPDVSVRADLVLGLARAAGPAGMVGGQALDLAAEKRREPPSPDLHHVRRLHAMKTGALIRWPCEAGALLGGATPTQRATLADYGRHLGLAFQIADDLLDATGDEATLGKAVAKDAAAGKATMVSLLGLEGARAELARAEAAAIAALEPFGAPADILRETARFVSGRRH